MSAEVCPYCRTAIAAEDVSQACEGCGTVHHADCYAENGACTIFGCSKAPGDEPKLSVSTPELVAVPAAATTTGPDRPLPPPPPPRPGTSASSTSAAPYPSDGLRQVGYQVVPSIFGGFGDASTAPAEPVVETPQAPKSRTTYIVLGALLGAFGAHSFYAGYRSRGAMQLAITVLTLGFGGPMSWMWAVIDICTIHQDNHGVQFEA